MSDVKRCYRALEESEWVLDKRTLVDLAMESRSRAARFMIVGWYNLQVGQIERSRTCLAEAETSCENDNELSYVLHVESIALLCMADDVREALEKERRCLTLCRRTGDRYLVAKVLIQLGAIWNALEADELNRRLQRE